MDKTKLAELIAKAQTMKDAAAALQRPVLIAQAVTQAFQDTERPITVWDRFEAILAEGELTIQERTELENAKLPKALQVQLETIQWHPKQQEAIDLALQGRSFCLIGPAGTGKTTVMKAIAQQLQQRGVVGPLRDSTKFLTKGSPGMAIIAYTRRATNNIRRSVSDDMKNNCLTFHKLMEYEPVYYEVLDPMTGKVRNTMRFEPMRSAGYPLPRSLTTIAVEESSMFSTEFQAILDKALQHEVQFIYLGDIQQLPPTYGSAVLGYKLLDLPVVELTHVYRQALKSPIIRLAHRILSGKAIQKDEALAMSTPAYYHTNWPGEFTEEEASKAAEQLKIRFYPKKVHWEPALYATANLLKTAIDAGVFSPEEDVVLIPINGHANKMNQFGSEELNKHIAQHISMKAGEVTWEIVAGFNKHYFAPGDKVMYDKEDAVITKIHPNLAYGGSKRAQKESAFLDRWGARQDKVTAAEKAAASAEGANPLGDLSTEAIDAMMAAAASQGDEDRVVEASHVVTIEFRDGGELKLNTAGQVNTLALAYCMTVHKAQGCEWRKVYLLAHHSHAQMINRELLYTAVTRAREELTILCEPDTFIGGLVKQRIKGNTLAEKAEFFKGKRQDLLTNGEG